MEEEQMTNTAEAARKRREVRRRRILENSDNRMKRLVGYNDGVSELTGTGEIGGLGEGTNNMWREARQDGIPGVVYRNIQQGEMGQGMRVSDTRAPGVESHMLRPGTEQHYTQEYYSSTPVLASRRPHGQGSQLSDNNYSSNTSQDLLSPDLARPPIHTYTSSHPAGIYSDNSAPLFSHQPLNSLLGNTQQPVTQQQLLATAEVTTFNKKRSVFCLVLGILVRLILCTAIGRKLVQSMVYPFFATEIIFLGYQQAAGMDIGSGMQSGLWLTVLMLCGLKRELIESYKLIMTIITTIGDDFTIYFFAFAIVHAAGKYFV